MTVISLCDYTGVMVEPWLEAGHNALIVDLKHPAGESEPVKVGKGWLVKVGADIRKWSFELLTKDPIPGPDSWDAAFAFPPCTDLAGSGARWWAAKGQEAVDEAMSVVHACHEICSFLDKPWFIENPVGRLSRLWRKPNFYFHPYEYGGYLNPPDDAYTKRTCLWTGGGFRLPAKRPVDPVEGSKMWKLPPTPDRGDLRSVTPRGFARAVFEELSKCGGGG